MTFTVYENDALKSYVDTVSSYNERYLVNKIVEYANNPREHFGHVLTLYGLRRSGKTTAMLHAIKRLGVDKSLYILCNTDTDIKELFEYATKSDKIYIFIDEVTLIDDFIINSSELADGLGGQKSCVVLSGTDSFSFLLAKDELFDRRRMIHTLPISLYDYKETMGVSNIKEFIELCGTMDKLQDDILKEYDALREYVATAIIKNIKYSFGQSVEADMSDCAMWISAVFARDAHELLDSAIEGCKKIPEFSRAFKYYKNKFPDSKSFYENTTRDALRELQLLEDLNAWVPFLKNREQKVLHFMRQCDLIIPIDVRDETGAVTKQKNCLMFTRLRYCMTKILLSILSENPLPKGFEEEVDRQILGFLLEDLVTCFIFSAQRKYRYLDVFKLRTTDDQEVDVVVHDKADDVYDLYEVKYSSDRRTDFCKYLFVNYPFMTNVRNRFVIYNGETHTTDSVHYVNAFEFLSSPAFKFPRYVTI